MANWEVTLHFQARGLDSPEEAEGAALNALGENSHRFALASVREVRAPRPVVQTRGKGVRATRLAAWTAGQQWAQDGHDFPLDGGLPGAIFGRAAELGITDPELVTEFVLGVQNAITVANLDRQDKAWEARRNAGR